MLMKEKVDLAKNIIETKLMPTDWVYDNVFRFSEDSFGEYRDMMIEDAKREFRIAQIREEGNDPVETGKSYGTPHDLATLYSTNGGPTGELPAGYNDDTQLGRPKEKVSTINTQDNPLGRDRLGVSDMKKDDQPGYGKTNGKSMALENAKSALIKNKRLLEQVDKKLVFKQNNAGDSLLDESQIRE
jgi:hypothetical protein